jgi:hypothetical protein
MTEAGDRMNRPQAPPDPDPWTECESDDGCHTMVHEEDEAAPLCWMHYMDAIEEEQADTARKIQKEDETWND